MLNVQINTLNLLMIKTPDSLSGAHIILIQGGDVLHDSLMTCGEFRDIRNLGVDYKALGWSEDQASMREVKNFVTGNLNTLTIMVSDGEAVIICKRYKDEPDEEPVVLHREMLDAETTTKLLTALNNFK